METKNENPQKQKNDWLMRHKLLLLSAAGVFILAGEDLAVFGFNQFYYHAEFLLLENSS